MANYNRKGNGRFGICPYCGSDYLRKRGMAYTPAGRVQRYECCSCHRHCTKPILQPELIK